MMQTCPMRSEIVNKEEIVSGVRSEDSVTLRLSSLQVFTRFHRFSSISLFVFNCRKKKCSVFNTVCAMGFNVLFYPPPLCQNISNDFLFPQTSAFSDGFSKFSVVFSFQIFIHALGMPIFSILRFFEYSFLHSNNIF